MKNPILVLLLTVVCLCGHAQSVQFIADWHKDWTFQYDITKIAQKDQSVDTIHYTLTLTVIDSTEDVYKIKARYYGFYDNPSMSALIGDLLDSSDYEALQTIFYTTTNVGTIVGVDNAESLIEKIFKYTEAFMSALGQKLDSQTMGMLKKVYREETLLNTVYKEVVLLHSFLGYEFPLKSVSNVKVENAFGGEMDAKVRQTIEKYNPESQFCRVRQNSVFDKKQIKKAIAQLFTSAGINEKEMKGYRMSVVDECLIEYIANPGIPLFADVARGTMVSSKKESKGKYERIIITLQNDPAK